MFARARTSTPAATTAAPNGGPAPHAAGPARRVGPALGAALALGAAVVLASGGPSTTAQTMPAQPGPARIAVTVQVLADGEAPWEDRPLAIEGGAVLAGTPGVADPGDDLGSLDGVVRTYDVVAYRVSYDVLDAPARDLAIELELPAAMRLPDTERARLASEGCPGGLRLVDPRRLLCLLGDVPLQTSITGYLDLKLRVRGSAPDGTRVGIAASVTAANGRPDPDRCAESLADGCRARPADVRVSAALAMETGIDRDAIASERVLHRGEDGWIVSWPIRVAAGGDGDPRGDAGMERATRVLHDWWRVTRADGLAVAGIGELLDCAGWPTDAWDCDAAAPAAGGPAALQLAALDPDALSPTQPGRILVTNPLYYGRLAWATVRVFVPRQAVLDAGGLLNVTNCFATVPGDPNAPEFAPLDLAGAPNLGGLAEPLANNCVQLALEAIEPEERKIGLGKFYHPGRWNVLESVAAGERFEGVVVMANYNDDGGKALDGVVVCDKFDNATQEYVARLPGAPLASRLATPDVVVETVDGGPGPASDREAHAVAEREAALRYRVAGAAVVAQNAVVEFGTGPWGLAAPAGTDRGTAWHAMATAGCEDDQAVGPAGWVPESRVDLTNSGRGALDAADVNMIRVRLLVPLPAGISVRVRFPLRALPNPPGTFLVNYGTGRFDGASEWGSWPCYGAEAGRCPDPPSLDGTEWNPGPLGDAMVLVDAPTSIIARVQGDDPSAAVRAGGGATVRLEARVGRRGAWPLQAERRASSATITAVLPSALTYVPGSAVLQSEDANGNRRLDPDEDTDGDGVLDPETALEPAVTRDAPDAGLTTLEWSIGALVSGRLPRVVRFETAVDPLIPGGRQFAVEARIGDAAEPPAACENGGMRRNPDRCTWGRFTVANTSRAAIDMDAEPAWVPPGAPLRYRLRAANLTGAPIEWLDATALLPWNGDPRSPSSRFDGRWAAITTTVPADARPVEVWASARAPETLDAADGPTLDGALDPVTAYGGPGAGLGDADWPCRLEDVAEGACAAIPTAGDVTALRLWAFDPDPNARGTATSSRLPRGGAPLEIALELQPGQPALGSRFHASWGGRFDGLDLPAFAGAVARIGEPPRLFLPMTMARACDPSSRAIALVVDASTSMERPSGVGGTKMEAAAGAARRLIAATLGDGDGVQRLAIVGFNERAWVAQPVTDEPAALEAALRGLEGALAPGTRLDLGLAAGADVLSGAPAGTGVLVLLTDGVPTGVGAEAVVVAAEAARGAGIRILAIGYGRADAPDPADRIDAGLLAALAGPNGRSWVTPDAAALADAFDAVAAEVACPVPARWR